MKKVFLPLLALVALLAFQGCKSFQLPYGKDLKVTQLLGQTVPAAANIGFKFDEVEKRITGKAGCNNFNAPYTLKGSKLSFGDGVATKMACPQMEWEDKFLGMLKDVRSIKQVGNRLQLSGEGGKALAYLSE